MATRNLPSEILAKILRYHHRDELGEPDPYSRKARLPPIAPLLVCRHWHNVYLDIFYSTFSVNDMWSSSTPVYVTNFISALRRNRVNGHRVRVVVVNQVCERRDLSDQIRIILRLCPRIQTLHYETKFLLNDDGLKNLGPSLSQSLDVVKLMEVSWNVVISILEQATNLKELHLNAYSRQTFTGSDDTFKARRALLRKKRKSLTRLRIDGFTCTPDHLVPFIDIFTTIKHLEVSVPTVNSRIQHPDPIYDHSPLPDSCRTYIEKLTISTPTFTTEKPFVLDHFITVPDLSTYDSIIDLELNGWEITAMIRRYSECLPDIVRRILAPRLKRVILHFSRPGGSRPWNCTQFLCNDFLYVKWLIQTIGAVRAANAPKQSHLLLGSPPPSWADHLKLHLEFDCNEPLNIGYFLRHSGRLTNLQRAYPDPYQWVVANKALAARHGVALSCPEPTRETTGRKTMLDRFQKKWLGGWDKSNTWWPARYRKGTCELV